MIKQHSTFGQILLETIIVGARAPLNLNYETPKLKIASNAAELKDVQVTRVKSI